MSRIKPRLHVVCATFGSAHPVFLHRRGARAIALVRAYKRDLDSNRSGLREIRRELASRDYVLTEVRILDVLIWSLSAAT